MRKQVRTYTSLWNYQRTIFAISDLRLPVPVPLRQLGFFVALEFIFLIIFKLPIISSIASTFWYVFYVGLPGYLSWVLTNKKFDGKEPIKFIGRWIAFYFSHGETNRYEEVEEPDIYKYSGSITYRKRGEQ